MLMLTLNVIYVLVALAIIVMVLMQRGSGAAAGSGFGAGASGTVFGARGASNFLSKSTKYLAIAFFGISLFMAWNASRSAGVPVERDLGLMSEMATPAPAGERAPTSSTVPAAPATVPVESDTTVPAVPAGSSTAPAPSTTAPPPPQSPPQDG